MFDYEEYKNGISGDSRAFSRAYREAFLYVLINYADKEYRTKSIAESLAMSVSGNMMDDVTVDSTALTYEQKRRGRNEIIKIAGKKVEEYNKALAEAQARGERKDEKPVTTATPAILVDSFFESSLGQPYADHKSDWEEGAYLFDTLNDVVEKWSVNQQVGSPNVFVISPYDPMFVNADNFAANDSLGYIVGTLTPGKCNRIENGQFKLGSGSSKNIGVTQLNQIIGKDASGKNLYKKAFYIKGAYVDPTHSHIINPATENVFKAFAEGNLGNPVEMQGEASKCGFNMISHYVKSKSMKKKVKAYLMDQMTSHAETVVDASGQSVVLEGVEQAPDQYEFMRDMCKYLDERGIDFDIEIGRDGKLTAKVPDYKMEIRLLDRDEPEYRGRIYMSGRIVRLSSQSFQKNANLNIRDLATNKDCMTPIKYMLGDEQILSIDPAVRTVSGPTYEKLSQARVGEFTNYTLSNKANAPHFNTVHIATGRSANNSVLVGMKAMDGLALSVNLVIDPSPIANVADSDMVKFARSLDWHLSTFALRDATDEEQKRADMLVRLAATQNIPPEAIYPEDMSDDVMDVVDEDGTSSGAYRILKDEASVSPEHVTYYKHVFVREKINEWVNSAKDNHRALTNIEGLIDAYKEHVADESVMFEYSADSKVSELQMMYWNILEGNIEEAEHLGIHASSDMSVDELAEAIRAHYENYSEEYFGSVPHIKREGFNYENDGKGFNPSNVAAYTSGEGSMGIQQNFDYIEHMLLALEDDYDESFISSDDYIATRMKNSLIKFDSSSAVRVLCGKDFTLGRASKDSPHGLYCVPSAPFDKIKGLENKPFTRRMLRHTVNTLLEVGCDPTRLMVEVDANGIIHYKAYQSKSASWSATGVSARSPEDKDACLEGTIGQITEPGPYGELEVKTVVDSEKVIVPGYDAFFVNDDPNNPKPRKERLRLVGYEQRMKEAISVEIRKAAYTLPAEYNFTSHNTELNSVYQHLTDMSIPTDEFYANLPEPGKEPTAEQKTYINKIRTLALRARFPNAYSEKATTHLQSMLNNPNTEDAQNYDYYFADICEGNMRQIRPDLHGIFDQELTAGAKNQGIAVFIKEGVDIDTNTGEVIKENFEGRTPLMADETMEYSKYDTNDRIIMVGSQLITAKHTPRDVGVAMLTVEGYNFDDGYVVSKNFADRYSIDSVDGGKRPLQKGDKLSDFHGNKGVIGLVIDPDLYSGTIAETVKNDIVNIEQLDSTTVLFRNKEYHIDFDSKSSDSHALQAAKFIQKEMDIAHLDSIMELYHENPNLDICVSPYSGMSRFNGGTIRSLMDSVAAHKEAGTEDKCLLKLRDKNDDGTPKTDRDGNPVYKDVAGGMGYMNMIVVDMPVDVKTHFYDQTAIKEGKGRKASGQLAWLMQSKGAVHLEHECYDDNQIAFSNLREYLISIGLDMDEYSRIHVGYHPQETERRALIKLDAESVPELPYITKIKKGIAELSEAPDEETVRKLRTNLNKAFNAFKLKSTVFDAQTAKDSRKNFLDTLNATGGFMELPFPLTFNMGDMLGATAKNMLRQNGAIKEAMDAGASFEECVEGMFSTQTTGQTYTVNGHEKPTYGLPVLPPELRSGRELYDGTTKAHDYTNRYVDVLKYANIYISCEKAIDELNTDIANGTNASLNSALKSQLESLMDFCKTSAQAKYNEVTNDIIDRKFDTKHNVFRDEIMTCRLENSATAVWTADPHLKLNEVGMSMDHAVQLGLCRTVTDENGESKFELKPDARVFLWRDPCLHDGNACCMDVKIVDDLEGVAINPLMDKQFDGDFDGDSVGMFVPKSYDARVEMYEKFSFKSNMLNRGAVTTVVGSDGKEHVVNPLYMQSGLDVAANAYHVDKNLMTKFNDINIAVYEFEQRVSEDPDSITYVTSGRNGKQITLTGKKAIDAQRTEYLNRLNDWSAKALSGIAVDHIVLDSPETVISSLQRIVDSGAKGNPSKMRGLCNNLGIDYKQHEDGSADLSTVTEMKDENGNVITRSMQDGTKQSETLSNQKVAALKADDTAFAGIISQLAIIALRDAEPSGKLSSIATGLCLSYLQTQAVLDSKHDVVDAEERDTIIKFWGKDVWNGYKLTGFDMNNPNPDPDVLRNTKHNRIKRIIIDDKTGKPVEKKVPTGERDENGKMIYEPVYEYKNGEKVPVYEYEYVKCTKEEWIKQMEDLMCALKVNYNPDNIKDFAEIMHTTDVNRCAVSTDGRAIPNTHSCNTSFIPGIEDFGKARGSLLDRVSYDNDRKNVLLEAAVSEVKRPLLPGIAVDAEEVLKLENKSVALSKEFRKETDPDKKKELKQQLTDNKSAREELQSKHVANSGTFASKAMRKAVAVSEHNRRVRGMAAPTEEEWTPVVIGRKDSFLTADQYETGAAFMGESQEQYIARKESIAADEYVVTASSPERENDVLRIDIAEADSRLTTADSRRSFANIVGQAQERGSSDKASAQYKVPVWLSTRNGRLYVNIRRNMFTESELSDFNKNVRPSLNNAIKSCTDKSSARDILSDVVDVVSPADEDVRKAGIKLDMPVQKKQTVSIRRDKAMSDGQLDDIAVFASRPLEERSSSKTNPKIGV